MSKVFRLGDPTCRVCKQPFTIGERVVIYAMGQIRGHERVVVVDDLLTMPAMHSICPARGKK